jgi:ubiquinone biosynthesis protein
VVEGVCRGLDPDFDIWDAARPVAERWMREQMGAEATLARAAEGFSALGRLAQDVPRLVRNAENLSQMVAEGGVKLHPDSARRIAEEQEARSRPWRAAMLLLLGAIALLLLIMLGRLF